MNQEMENMPSEQMLNEIASAEPGVRDRAEKIVRAANEAQTGEAEKRTLEEIIEETGEASRIQEIRRLLSISAELERENRDTTTEEDLGIVKMIMHKARPLLEEQKVFLGERIKKINNVIKDFSEINEGILGRTFLLPEDYFVAGLVDNFSYDKSRFVFLKESTSVDVVDHELLHTAQNENCPVALVEALTSYFEYKVGKSIDSDERKKSKTSKPPSIKHPYFIDFMLGASLVKIVGEQAVGKLYFQGDEKNFVHSYKRKTGKNNLSRRLLEFQRFVQAERKVQRIKNKYVRSALRGVNSFRKLNTLVKLQFDRFL